MENLPIVGNAYNCFLDGKIKKSKLYKVKVLEIIPFSEIDDSTLQQWKGEAQANSFFYNKVTDYFIKTQNGANDIETFVRTVDNRWFSMGLFSSGLLDLDSSLTNSLCKK